VCIRKSGISFSVYPFPSVPLFPICTLIISVADPDPDPDPHVFGPPGFGSGSISQRYGEKLFFKLVFCWHLEGQ
jgi:hypothetical protein